MSPLRVGFVLASTFAFVVACGSSSSGGGGGGTPVGSSGDLDASVRGPEATGQMCKVPADCYTGFEAGALKGDVQCLDRVPDGYCTHLCTSDADCCAVPGECQTGIKQVCAPFESTGKMMCFISCEGSDVQPIDAGADADAGSGADAYCRFYGAQGLNCRSTGGGSKNRKICSP
jgi:hypothetical protein